MIAAVHSSDETALFFAAAQAFAPFEARLTVEQKLYGQKPGSGFSFFTSDKDPFALELIGQNGIACGMFDEEELSSLLRFLGVRSITLPEGNGPAGFIAAETLYVYKADPRIFSNRSPALPDSCLLKTDPSAMEVSRLVLEEETESEEAVLNYYSRLCTARNHGAARVWALFQKDKIVSTVGAYALHGHSAYLAGAETVPPLRKNGLGGILLTGLCAYLAKDGITGYFWCRPHLCSHYLHLGFTPCGRLTLWNNPDFAE